MEYKRIQDSILLRLDPGEEIVGKLQFLAEKEQIKLAEINGLGAVNDFTVGTFDTVKKEFHGNRFEGKFEITSLHGTITSKEGTPYLHLHMSAGDQYGTVLGGHLTRAVVSATAEIVLRVIDGCVERKMSQEIGLNLFEFN